MSLLRHELRLIFRTYLAVVSILLLTALAIASVATGMTEVSRQNDVIERILPQQEADVAAIAQWVDKEKDAGSAAYYTFHYTWDAPSPLAFATLGMRDVAPFILRVRALGLEAQLYEGEANNPELALPGRFDFSLVLVYLVPLFVITLFHDLKSGEREAGRLQILEALPSHASRLWLRRVMLRYGLVYAAVIIPFLFGAYMSELNSLLTLAVMALVAAYIGFWVIITLLVSRLRWSSTANAATLAAAWLTLTLVLPALSHMLINRSIPVQQGVELTLAQREKVHAAWEIPREETMAKFVAKYPEWQNSPPLKPGFEWKWYFAFHQLGDDSVQAKVEKYRQGLLARHRWTNRAGWVLPGVGIQMALARLADTDLTAQLAYQDRVRAYHEKLRLFYYDYLFFDQPFGKSDFDRAPTFD